MLADYARRARQDPALRSVALIEETRIPNHYSLEETFVNEAAYRRFVQQSPSAGWVGCGLALGRAGDLAVATIADRASRRRRFAAERVVV